MGKIIVEQIVSADGHAEDADGGIGFFANADWKGLVVLAYHAVLPPAHAAVIRP